MAKLYNKLFAENFFTEIVVFDSKHISELKRFLGNHNVTISSRARIKRAFTNKIFHSLEEISTFIDKAADEISESIVKSTCAYKYIFFDTFWNEI